MSLPRIVEKWVRRVVPPRFADDLVVDLAEGFDRRRDEGRGAWRWLLAELARTPWWTLRREGRRMGPSRHETPVSGPGHGAAGWMAGLRIAARTLLRRPSYALVSVLTLAVSIGAATLVFSVLEAVLLRPLPYPDGERLYRVYGTNAEWREAEQEIMRDSWDRLDVSRELAERLRTSPAFEAAGAFQPATQRIDDGDAPVQLEGAWLLPGFFEVLGVRPLAGRLPTEAEVERGDPVVVLGERLWSSRYGRDPEVLGRSIDIQGEPHTVIGVLPSRFATPSELARWWAPVPADFDDGRTDAAVFDAIVRLPEGMDAEAATATIEGVLDGLATGNPTYVPLGARVTSLADEVVSDVEAGLTLLFAAVLAVVLIASVNLANLVVARGTRRRSELAMRAALGATRWDLVWSMLSETALVCGVGGGIGVLIATRLLDPFTRLLVRATPGFPRIDEIGLNLTVLGFSAGVALLTTILAGLFPAIAASRRSPWKALQEGRRSRGGRATRRTQRSLLLVESALAMTLLVVAGLLVRSALEVSRLDPGYEPESVAYLSLGFPEGSYGEPLEAAAVAEAVETRLARLPGTVDVARASSLPGLGGAQGDLVWTPDRPVEDATLVWGANVSPGYFDVMGIPLTAGRDFEAADGYESEPVAIVSELFVERFFPEAENVVGRTVLIGSGGTRMSGGAIVTEGERELRVVGVVDDVRQLAVVLDPDAMLYRPIAQTSGRDPHLVIRTTGDPAEVLRAARAEVQAEDGTLLVSEADVLSRSMRRLMAPLEVRMILLVGIAVLAAVLTAVGIYGVVSHVVSDQLHEIGVRMALGAKAAGESTRMVTQALGPVLLGAGFGLVGAWWASRLVESALFGVQPLDAWTYGGVLLLLVGTAALAAWWPARRAATVDPVRVLSDE